ncbi:IclR family transcriptional regulator [Paraburkholderia tropica]|uniref:IclR family transcriptional regulator n=1 Tax=Paraburkholderia tropica TaxID=92647 RepID=UPI0038B784FD
MNEVTDKPQRGIQSVEVAGRILEALALHRQPMALSELAGNAGLPTGQAHTYLVSLTRLGLVKRDALTGYYEPGPLSLRLGLIFVEQQEAYRVAASCAEQLAERIGYSVAVCVAGTQGPTIVRYERGGYPLHVNLHIGTVMALETTSTGRVFSAFLEPVQLAAMMERQGIGQWSFGTDYPVTPDNDIWRASLADTRRRSMARSVDIPSPGISSLSVPVLDGDGHLQLALTVVGPSGAMDVSWTGEIALELRAVARRITEVLNLSAPNHAL